MATVKIILGPNETEAEAKELLIKALSHEEGEEHHEAFHQPAAREVIQVMTIDHDVMWQTMLEQIFQVLEEEA